MASEAQGWRPQFPRVTGLCAGGTRGHRQNETRHDLAAERMDWTQDDEPGTRFSQTLGDAPAAKATGLSSETNACCSGILSDSWPEVSPLLPRVDVCLSEWACVRPLRGHCLPPGVDVCPPSQGLVSPTWGGRVSV